MSWEDGVFKTPEDIRVYGDVRAAAERERIIDLIEDEAAHLIAKGDLISAISVSVLLLRLSRERTNE
jgi:hypothetical protein